MLEFYLRSTRGITRARSSLIGLHLDGFAAALRELGYCRLVGQWCITYAVHLGLWLAAEDVALGALDEGAVQAFLAHLSRCRCPGHRAGRHSVARARTAVFMRYLRAQGIVPLPAPPAAPPRLNHWVLRVDAVTARQRGDDPAPVPGRCRRASGATRRRPRAL